MINEVHTSSFPTILTESLIFFYSSQPRPRPLLGYLLGLSVG